MDKEEYRRLADNGDSHWWFRSTRALLRQLIEDDLDPSPGAIYLDAAGATGATGGWMSERNPTVLADVEDFAVQLGRDDFPGYLPVLADINHLPLADDSFAGVLCVTALCHRMNTDPGVIVREFARITRPGGIVCILEPGGKRLWRSHDNVTHTGRRFSVRELRDMATAAGLEIVRSTGAYSFLVPPAAVRTLFERNTVKSDVSRNQSGLGGLLGAAASLERRWLRRLDIPFGLSAIVVARAPGNRRGVTITLGYNTGYWGSGPPAGALDAILEAERLGYDSVWTAEAYGSDCLTPLAWWGASTTTVKLGTGITQISARTPAATAMAAMTLDHLSNGRFILGLGASGPQVVEGWYGQPYPKPLARTREYISVVRDIVRRDAPVQHSGEFYTMPYAGGTGLGKALKSTIHPLRREIPIYLGAEGPKNVALAAELCDGWMPLFFSPKEDAYYRGCLAEGFAAAGDADKADRFQVAATVTIVIGDDAERCADAVRPFLALYAGGMGARGVNFHFEVFARMGYEDVALQVQELYLAGKKAEAAAAIPLAMVEDVALVGPVDKIRDELQRWQETCITSLLVSGPKQMLATYADLILG